ncbi:hypothetical protein [Emticicia sp. 21SJ11W-3]|uniref:hypothetical protein n=1 Tax=Emticicia sp. 21SJ11W-3 TaxID=2916755 RepID=UPI00209F85E0|nr:hypothetical protein [Emticicia sp. 21SJ11W-3]UTA66660.1 hypothetical protein MB380_13725 [Emticicia sp. 21SJ11W-3]
MKKIFILLALTIHHAFAQSGVYQVLDNKTIVSVFYKETAHLDTEPTTVVDEKNNMTIITNYSKGVNRFSVTRNLAFKGKDAPILTFKIMRVQDKNSRYSIDTHAPFGSDEISKMAVENYLPLVKKSITIKLKESNELTKTEEEIIELSRVDLPELHSAGALSGVLLNWPVGNTGWTDSIAVREGYYVNSYVVLDEAKKQYKLKGYFVPLKKSADASLKKNNDDYNNLVPGKGIQAESEIVEVKYEGVIGMSEKYQMLIQNIELDVYSAINLTIMGRIESNRTNNKIRLINKVEE